MIPFRLRKDAKGWFKHLIQQKEFTIDFDVYYCCVMAGLATKRKVDATTERTTELPDHFPKLYREQSRILIALFLSRELGFHDIDLAEKEAVRKMIRTLVAPSSPSHLSADGVHELNKYASGGFEVLLEWFEDPPRALSTFLPLYKRRLDKCLRESASRDNDSGAPVTDKSSQYQDASGNSL